MALVQIETVEGKVYYIEKKLVRYMIVSENKKDTPWGDGLTIVLAGRKDPIGLTVPKGTGHEAASRLA